MIKVTSYIKAKWSINSRRTLKTQARPLFKGPHKEDKNIENSHEKNS